MDPEEIERRIFVASLRGYSRDEVDSFLQDVAQEIRELQRQLTAAAADLALKSSELSEKSAQLAELQSRPEAPVPADSRSSHDRVQLLKQVGEETQKILLAAEQVAEEIHDRAIKEAAEIVTDARLEADKIFREVEDRKKGEQRELSQIMQVRGMIASQLEDILRRLEETIVRLRTPVEAPPPVKRLRPVKAAASDSKAAAPPAERAVASVAEPAEAEVAAPPSLSAMEVKTGKETPGPSEVTQKDAEVESATAGDADQAAPEPSTVAAAIATGNAEPAAVQAPPAGANGGNGGGALDELLDEIRRERDERRGPVGVGKAGTRARREARTEEVGTAEGQAPALEPEVSTAEDAAPDAAVDAKMLRLRAEALGDLPVQASRRMKRLLQEDQNDLLDRLRTQRGKGTLDENLPTVQEQFGRFQAALKEVLGRAFGHGRQVGGAPDEGDSTRAVNNLVARQVLNPLRAEISRTVQAGLEAGDTANAIAERANDVFRVWKGVRTELLGEGMVYAAFHQGLVDAWTGSPGAQKSWVVSPEHECPNAVCQTNGAAGPVAVNSPFPSGHLTPPAHGGCSCALELSGPQN